MKKNSKINVSIIMGSQSDYSTMKYAEKTLKSLGIKFEKKIVSAHRTPKRMYEYALNVEKIILMLLLQVMLAQNICQEW